MDVKQGFNTKLNCKSDSGVCQFGGEDGFVSYRLPDGNMASLMVSGINWPLETRLVIYASLRKKAVEFQFACSNTFVDGITAIVRPNIGLYNLFHRQTDTGL